MRSYCNNTAVLGRCHIWKMLEENAEKPHLSFHTPGHKNPKYDITELSFSDNLSCPQGVLLQAEQDVASILGADRSFLLTDGSTSGVLSMLYALKLRGVMRVAAPLMSHKSFWNGCALLGLTPILFETPERALPMPLQVADVEAAVREADALFLTSPDYYGNVADLQGIQSLCKHLQKPLVIDGAHGGHLHFYKDIYAGAHADMWVDGVHKSLPAFTQGAVVSAKGDFVESLARAVDVFRTTSPSYPIMASVEYAVKYPKNDRLRLCVETAVKERKYLYKNADYTKLCAFCADGFQVEKLAIEQGIYTEFATQNAVCFYLSPVQTEEELGVALRFLDGLKEEGLVIAEKDIQRIPAPHKLQNVDGKETEQVPLQVAVGRVCGKTCGLFPPCLPLILWGEVITKEKTEMLKKAANVFGIEKDKITVVKE